MRKPQGLRRLRTDRFGGIEGMPLQLLIMVIVLLARPEGLFGVVFEEER